MRRNEFLIQSLRWLGAGLLLPAVACKQNDPTPSTTTTASSTATGDCVESPSETAGPYPKDLSALSAMFRSDITEGKPGVPLNLTLTVVNSNDDCKAVENARVDIWHCDKDGYYSGYSEPGYLGTKNYVGETFCRGIQLTDASGQVKFATIYPGWYTGRIAHIHIEVFVNSVLKKTTQMAFPDAVNTEVYKTSLYATHGQNTSVANNAADTIFGDSDDDLSHELCTIAANSSGGYDASLTIGVSL